MLYLSYSDILKSDTVVSGLFQIIFSDYDPKILFIYPKYVNVVHNWSIILLYIYNNKILGVTSSSHYYIVGVCFLPSKDKVHIA